MSLSLKAIIVLLVLAIFPGETLADQEGSGFSYRAHTADRRHVFVMLNREDPAAPEDKDEMFPLSGMYLNDGTASPLWTVEWGGSVYLPNGGEYIVKRGRWARYSGTYGEEAFTFYSRNQPLRSYSAKELVDFPWLLSHTASHYTLTVEECENSPGDGSILRVGGSEYPNNGSVRFDEGSRTMAVRTQLGDWLVFDLANGEMVSASRPARMICIAAFTFFLAAYLFFRYRFAGSRSPRGIHVVVGFIAPILLIVVPTGASYLKSAAACMPEYSPTLFTQIWLAFYLFPPFVVNLIVPSSAGSETVITVSSVATGAQTAVFWSILVLAFALLDRLTARVVLKLRGDG
jgi:hypothetical protein